MIPEGEPRFIEKPPDTVMTFWVIFESPPYFAGYVLRAQFVARKAPDNDKFGIIVHESGDYVTIRSRRFWFARDPDHLIKMLPPSRVGADVQDPEDPSIFQTWVELPLSTPT